VSIRSLLEHVGAIERGQKITVEGREVDRPPVLDRAVFRIRRIRDRAYELMIKDL
jgi:hypothetical protein